MVKFLSCRFSIFKMFYHNRTLQQCVDICTFRTLFEPTWSISRSTRNA